jgi:magnesium transporter
LDDRNLEIVEMRTELARLAEVRLAGEHGSEAALRSFLEAVNPIDVATSLGDLEDAEVTAVFDALGHEAQAKVLSEADPKVQALLLMHVGERGASLLAALDPDDAADVLDAATEPQVEDILRGLEREDAEELRQLREYGAETAGGLMTTEVVALAPELTVAEALDRIREEREAETVSIVYVVSDHGHLLGVLSIRDLLLALPDQRVKNLMTTRVLQVHPGADQEEVIRTMETYHLSVIPVVDDAGLLLGIVTSDDVLTALENEASEDVMKLAGASGNNPTRQSVRERVWARLPYLMVTLGGTMLSALIIRLLTDEAEVGVMAYFIPVVGGMGGNVGMQSAAVIVRGFATGEVDQSRIAKVIFEEFLTGGTLGFLSAMGAFVIALLMAFTPIEGLTVAMSLFCATLLAAAAGTMIPTVCARLGVDPAISAGPFITTLNDILGISVYIGIATVMLPLG